MKNFAVLSLVFLLSFPAVRFSGAGISGPPKLAARPNILLIIADDLGYGALSCQGNPQIPTPNIDSIASNGIRFTSGYVSGPYCSPTRAGLMTGRYQQRFGHEFNPGPAQAASDVFGISLKESFFNIFYQFFNLRSGNRSFLAGLLNTNTYLFC